MFKVITKMCYKKFSNEPNDSQVSFHNWKKTNIQAINIEKITTLNYKT